MIIVNVINKFVSYFKIDVDMIFFEYFLIIFFVKNVNRYFLIVRKFLLINDVVIENKFLFQSVTIAVKKFMFENYSIL